MIWEGREVAYRNGSTIALVSHGFTLWHCRSGEKKRGIRGSKGRVHGQTGNDTPSVESKNTMKQQTLFRSQISLFYSN
jgi:hypothetical protein